MALPHVVRGVALLLVVFSLTACGTGDQGNNVDPDQVDAVEAPELGACRVLTPDDVEAAEQRDQDRRLRRAAHRGDVRGR